MAKRKVVPLSDTEIKNAKPREKEYTLPDGNGLQLLIKPDGKKIWEIRYTLEGKAKKTTAGVYPKVSLKEARSKRDEYKSKVSTGIDPIKEKREAKQSKVEEIQVEEALQHTQFHNVVYEWLSTLKNDDVTSKKRKRSFERDLFPHFCQYDEYHHVISSKPIGEITHGELLKIITTKGQTAAETASRLFADCKRLWTYAVSHEYIDLNITARIDKSVVPKSEYKNMPKITDEKILGELLRAIDKYHGEGGVILRNLLRFVSIVPLRADNLCKMRWEQVDFENGMVTFKRSEMKAKNKNLPDFIVPLPRQALEILKEVQTYTGWGKWVFHGVRDIKTHVNLQSAGKALKLMGFNDEDSGRRQRLHSFRGTFRSLSETYAKEHGASFEVRERCLDHHETNKAVRAYTHKADYTAQMRELLQWWADFLDVTKQKA